MRRVQGLIVVEGRVGAMVGVKVRSRLGGRGRDWAVVWVEFEIPKWLGLEPR